MDMKVVVSRGLSHIINIFAPSEKSPEVYKNFHEHVLAWEKSLNEYLESCPRKVKEFYWTKLSSRKQVLNKIVRKGVLPGNDLEIAKKVLSEEFAKNKYLMDQQVIMIGLLNDTCQEGVFKEKPFLEFCVYAIEKANLDQLKLAMSSPDCYERFLPKNIKEALDKALNPYG